MSFQKKHKEPLAEPEPCIAKIVISMASHRTFVSKLKYTAMLEHADLVTAQKSPLGYEIAIWVNYEILPKNLKPEQKPIGLRVDINRKIGNQPHSPYRIGGEIIGRYANYETIDEALDANMYLSGL